MAPSDRSDELGCEVHAFLRRLGAGAALGSAAAGFPFVLRPPGTGNSIAGCWRLSAAFGHYGWLAPAR
jgi:hypothetical protein